MESALERRMMVRRTGNGPRIVWLHGLGESSASFEPVVARMPGFAHVLVDLPGYGRSPWPAHAPGLVDVADELAGWVDAGATLVGHSMGGVLATLVAERTAVRGVVDVDGNLSLGDCVFSAQASAYTLDDFCAHGFAAMRAKVYADGADRPALRGYFAAMCLASPHVFHRQARELVELSESGTLAPRLVALRAPALFIAGVPDGVCAYSRALLDRHGVRWVGIKPAGHWVYLDQIERFTAEVARFVVSFGQ